MRLRIDAFDVARFTWKSKEEREQWFRSFAPRAVFEIEPLGDTSGKLLHVDLIFGNPAEAEEFRESISYKFNISASEVPE